jgi:hypothetical protein
VRFDWPIGGTSAQALDRRLASMMSAGYQTAAIMLKSTHEVMIRLTDRVMINGSEF